MNKSKDWGEFNEHLRNNNIELIKQIEEIEEKQGLPKGAIAELLYQRAREGYKAGAALAKVLADTIEGGSTTFDKLATAMAVVCKTASPDKYGVTIEELIDSLAYITKDQPSPMDVAEAYKKTRKSVDRILNPTDKAKDAMKIAGILFDTVDNANLEFNRLAKALKKVIDKYPPGKMGVTEEEMKMMVDLLK